MGPETSTMEALNAIRTADVLIGAKRMVETFAHLGKQSYDVYQPNLVADIIKASDAQQFAILVSGDVGFYSGAAALYDRLQEYAIKLIPGISTVSYFFAKCALPWQSAALVSCHGTDLDIVGSVRRNRLTFVLTGGNIPTLADILCAGGFGHLSVYVGEKLGLPGEEITQTTVSTLDKNGYASLSVLLIENEGFDPRVRTGIPDGEFMRSQLPMTKAEVRAVCLSKLGLRPTDICYDIGCGTGSVTVEMALSAYQGWVYAIDKNETALMQTKENYKAFHIGNISLVNGTAPEALSSLPVPDVAFIGGSSGNMNAIVKSLRDKSPRVRIVITAIAIESVSAAMHALDQIGMEPELVQISVAHAKPVGKLHMMNAQNPVFIVSGGYHE
jgi:precorrin-6Y C5,15-methyltransferase (decarboxylating)